MSDWISVKDRLPEFSEPVLVFYGYESYCVATLMRYHSRNGSTWYMPDKWLPGPPTHWMPLPEPPEGET